METDKSAVLLEGILETLKLIQGGLEAQEKRWEWLEKRLGETEKPGMGDEAEAGSPDLNDIETHAPRHILPGTIAFVERSELPPLVDDEAEDLAPSPGLEIAERGARHYSDVGVDTEESYPVSSSRSVDSLASSNSGRSSSPGNSFEDLQRSDAWRLESTIQKVEKVPRVDYADWNSPLADSPLQQNPLVQKELGDAWTIPYDSRLPLLFSRDHLEKLDGPALGRLLPVLAAFRDKMKRDAFVDFKIIDRVGSRQISYRLGEPADTKGCLRVPVRKVDNEAPPSGYDLRFPYEPDAPWSRFIFCQGLNIAQLDLDEFHLPKNEAPNMYAPFLSRSLNSKGWRNWFTSVSAHIHCKRLAFSPHREQVNQYRDYGTGFHITFFEILHSYLDNHPKFEESGRWNRGPLYGSIGEDRLCESSFTMIEIPGFRKDHAKKGTFIVRQPAHTVPVDTWTVLLLSPPRFFGRAQSTPLCMDGPMHSVAIHLLHFCFRDLRLRWTELRDHLEKLLDEGDALFNPPAHDKLLWDDEIFTRSRKYFWAIHCLTEFHLSISDNILQWENYYEARIEPLRQGGFINGSNLWKLDEMEEWITTMKNTRLYFSEKLISTKALRDGLFNASAVVESRASTRLGENVKLLTLVSIFFLPLAFCTSLWSINTLFSTTTLIYTIIIIGLSTYIIVFNLNNFVLQASKSYQTLRDHLVKKMKGEPRPYNAGFWPEKGTRFDVFRPMHEKAHPSEWWILIFVFHLIFEKALHWLPLRGSKKVAKEDTDDDPSTLSIVSSTSAGSFSVASSTPRSSLSRGPETPENDRAADPHGDHEADIAVPSGEMKPDSVRTAPNHHQPPDSGVTADTTPRNPTPENENEKSPNHVAVTSPSHQPKRRSLAEKTLSKLFGTKKHEGGLGGSLV